MRALDFMGYGSAHLLERGSQGQKNILGSGSRRYRQLDFRDFPGTVFADAQHAYGFFRSAFPGPIGPAISAPSWHKGEFICSDTVHIF